MLAYRTHLRVFKTCAANALLQALDDGGDALADADAHRRQAVAPAAPLQLVEQRRHQPRAGAAEWMAERDGAAIDVDLRRVQFQLADALERLRGERLIQFDEVEIGGR